MAKKKQTRMETRDLPVKLTTEQLNDRSRELVATLEAIEEETDAKKREADRRNGIIKDMESNAAKLCRTVKTGEEDQPVRCVVTFDYKDQKVIVTRDDTDALVETRSMTQDELQQGLEEVMSATEPPPAPPPVIDLVAALESSRPVVSVPKQLPAANLDQQNKADFESRVQEALAIIRETKRAALATIQRRLRIGSTLAVAIMEELEARGIVGPALGDAPREILNLPDEPATT